MSYMGMIIMSNKNALIAMAHVSENANNPYHVYCEYIKYCIFTSNKNTITIKEALDAVKNEFGIYMPHNVFIYCLDIIAKEGLVKQENNQISQTGSFDISEFEKTRLSFRDTENSLINELLKYVSRYGLDWDYEKAREQLIKVLDNGLAYEIFIHEKDVSEEMINDALELQIESDQSLPKNSEDLKSQPLYSDSFYVGRFICQILSRDNPAKEYLLRVCEGLMISIGANQLPSSGKNYTLPQIKGTEFYFDTRLLLRYIGCASDAAVKATQELVGIIQSAGGKIYYYPQTFTEMELALNEAFLYKSNKTPYIDYEMRIYAQDKNPTVISAKKASLEEELAKSNIYLKPLGDYSEKDKIRFGFDFSDWQQYLEKNLGWESKVIENDALSIWETHMNRQGNYQDYCGTKKRLCVFVTNNSRLVNASMKYKEDRPSIKNISSWRTNRLPVITDIRLTCRLWSPAEQCERMALLYLTSNAIAAQRPTKRYVNEMRNLVSQISTEAPEYAGICLSAYFDDNVTELFFEKNCGNESEFNVGNLASSIEELAEFKAIEEQKRTKEYEKRLNESENLRLKTNAELIKHKEDIIKSAVDANKNTLGIISKLILRLALNWSIVISTLFTGITAIVSFISQQWCILFIIIIPVALCIAEKFFTSQTIKKNLLSKICPKIITSYSKRIEKELRDIEKPYTKEIIAKSIEKTSLLNKCL